MRISCLCPTYNRFPYNGDLVNEAVHSFLRQDYPDKELIVCNDTPGQYIRISEPSVRVINLQERMPTLSDKIQFMVEQAQGELLCRWDDDDISLPHRLSFSIDRLLDCGREEWRPANYWYCEGTKTPEEVAHAGNTHIMALWHRSVLAKMGGTYPKGLSGIEDQQFNRNLTELGHPPAGERLLREEMFYLYRWGVSPTHLSGRAGGPPENPHQGHYDAIGQQSITPGLHRIIPRWRKDYSNVPK